MKKILIAIKKNSLLFTYNYKLDDATKSLMNTNVISDNELVFSDDYILENSKIVSSFIKEIINDNNINQIVLSRFEMLRILKNVFINLDSLETLFISDETNFTYEAYEIITALKKFKHINCYSIPTYMIDLFDKKNITVESRAEILFTSNFVEINNLVSYSKMYYKTSLKVSPPLTIDDLNDFDTFIKINKYLKVIHFDACSLDGLDKITTSLINNRVRNVKIVINDNITNREWIEELKIKKKQLAKFKIYLELKYTDEYVGKNFIKQLISTTLIFCAGLAFILALGSTIYVVTNNKISEKNVEEITNRIEAKITQDNIDRLNNKEEFEEKETIIEGKKMLPKMASIFSLNGDSVGWLTVPGTNIDYPVLQTSDNDYYLNHNFDKQPDYNGWVYMNKYNNSQDLDKNTIIFAHNRYYSGVMFGTLSKVTKKEWYSQADKISIFYDTLFENYEAEVFSIYKINVTDDYLKTTFESDNDWLDFIEKIRARSLFQSNAKVLANDKIITLSTCLDNDRRLVVHAVLKAK